jgi:bifunctional non-homologous end joining protein LigD
MALDTYRRKRNFRSTSEPRGGKVSRQKGHGFVVQKHAARRLHYDFRLEMDGVLKSWAVAKGPSLIAGEKRLAVHVEDHPLEYGEFEGTIPKGEYGGGTVILWDRGIWTPIGDPARGYAKGHLDFSLEGEKLGGRWHLVRMSGKRREKRENWLLIKGSDDDGRAVNDPDILDERPESVKTGRVIEDVAGEAPGWSSKTGRIEPENSAASKAAPNLGKIKGARKSALPPFVEPVLATLSEKAPVGKRWMHEIKFDGYRLQARIEAGRVKLLTRSGLDWTRKFGKTLPRALLDLPVKTALIDGELVVENDSGASDFSALQADLSEGRSDRFMFYAFDLMHLDGFDLRDAALEARKELLRMLLDGEHAGLRFSTHFEESGDMILRHACRLSLEGVISKNRDSPYRSGRGNTWLKSKCSERQEFIICGYVPSATARKAIGSLVLGYYHKKELVHAGRVGTGFTSRVAEELYTRLEKIRQANSPFAKRLPAEAGRQVRFVRPQFVAEIEFRAWSADHVLRHASFRGVREDKSPEDIVRERKSAIVATKPSHVPGKLTHADRLYWPADGVTKQGLAEYYTDVWSKIAPFIVERPLSLVRCPSGIVGECFFQKHAWNGLSPAIVLARDPKDKADEPIIAIRDLEGLIGLVQAGVLEIHPWGSPLKTIEQPDFIVMDLDPGENVTWPEIVAAAREVRERLLNMKLASFVKTSGGKGLHVVTPLEPRAEWDEVKSFTKSLADTMARDNPDRYVSTVTKAKRHGKILVDYLRNGRGATAVAAYSTRARAGAPVAMPLDWNELETVVRANYFTVLNALTRLESLARDPWQDFWRAARPLPAKTSSQHRTKQR